MYRISALAAVAAALLLSACGGSSKPQAASQSGSPRGPHNAHAAYAFSACMRNHGVTNFPDPQVLRKGNSVNVAIAITPAIASSPAFKSAQKTCGHLLPFGQGPSPAQQKAQADAMLAFAQCMRRHGFARFPDPSSQGQLSLQAIQAAGINLK
ncbi:MAG TPA: hypothetical protein VME01_04675, partial [Solirubrobacteraceae bacterium]|nr:hypothetical protein [Solirubrobacteraceae bacterium]